MTADQAPSRPLLIMVTGEPGSGKTTLGVNLSQTLRLPFLSRDHLRGGLLATAGLWTDRLDDPPPREAAAAALTTVVEAATGAGVSVVVEFVVTPERTEVFRRLTAAARCLVIQCVCADAPLRAERRDRADPLLNRLEVLTALGHRSIEEYVDGPERARVRAEMRRHFDDLPLLRVHTDDGYDPPLEDVIDWVIERTRDLEAR